MDSIALYNQNGQKFDVEVIRYFENSGNKYLIFSLNEIDENGYIQLYLSKVVNGEMVTVTDESEWADFRNAIQKIVTNNRNNIEIENDLDFNELNEAKVSTFRIFKLKNEVAKILAANKNANKTKKEEVEIKEVTKEEVKDEPKNLQDASARDTGLTIEEILKKVSEGAKNAREITKVVLDKTKHEEVENDSEVDLVGHKVSDDTKEILNQIDEEMTEEEWDKLFEVCDFDYPAIIAEPLPECIKEALEEDFDELLKTCDFDYPAIIAEPLPETAGAAKESNGDYEAKYNDLLTTMRKLEEENMRLINEVIEAKAQLATIKDILN